jgi:hypothetical protein
MSVASESSRAEQIENALKAAKESDDALKIPIPYKGQSIPLTVARVPVTAVVYNPYSHRIRAQLESHPNRDQIEAEPFSDESQDAIAALLQATEGFPDLKQSLEEYTQREAGVVTRKGVLVDGNTRLAALREIGQDYIDVAVLPEDADAAEIDKIESDIQFRRTLKQDYSFTNYLLLLDDLLNKLDYTEEKVAKELNWSVSSDETALKKGVNEVRLHVRLLARVREIQALSGNLIPLTFFDDVKQSLIDLDGAYESLRNEDPDGAERLKDARIAGILVGTKYRDLREVTPESIGDVLIPQLEDKDEIGPVIADIISPSDSQEGAKDKEEDEADDDLDLLDGGDGSDDDAEPALGNLTKVLATSYGSELIDLGDGRSLNRDNVVEEVAEAVEEAAEDFRISKKEEKNLNGPVKQLGEAVKKARSALSGYKEFHGQPGFKKGKFSYHTNKLRIELNKIEAVLNEEEK